MEMLDFVAFQKPLLALGSVTAVFGGVYGMITPDALVPAFSLAAGVAVGVVYLWKAPRDDAVRRHIENLTRLLDQEIDAHNKTRRKLRLWREAGIDAGLSVKEPLDEVA